MGGLIGAALWLGYLALILVAASHRRGTRPAFAEFAERNGLRVVRRRLRPCVRGRREGVPFSLTGGRDLVLVAEGARFGARPRSLFLGGDGKTGDPAVDDALHLTGDPLVLMAIAARARPLLARMAAGEPISVENGRVVLNVLDPSRIDDELLLMTQTVQASLLDEHGLVLAVASGVDPRFPVAFRRSCLERLVGSFPHEPVTKDCLRAAFSDPDFHLRLYAATRAGSEGVPVLEGIVLDPQAPAEVRIQALQFLSDDVFERTIDRNGASATLIDALPRLSEARLGLALDALSRSGAARAAHAIRALLPSTTPEDRARAERALGAIEARLAARHGELSLAAEGDGGLTLSGGGGELSLDRREKQKT